MRELFVTIFLRDLRLAARRRVESLLPLVFFIVAVSLFPLGVGPEPQTLRQIAPGIVWVCALLASMLSVNTLYAGDHADGSLEQMLLAPQSALAVAQELYDGQGKKIITYPRAEVRYLPQSLIPDVPKIVAGLQVGQSFATIPVPMPPVTFSTRIDVVSAA